jgi:hypothetical protein
VIGVGAQGANIVSLSLDLGYRVLGAVDVGDKVGRRLGELLDDARLSDQAMYGSIEELLADAGTPDVAVLSALITTERNTELACSLLEQGINCLALDANLFQGQGKLAERIHAAGVAGAATFTASGMQDTWWVHLPALVASSNHRITRVEFDDFSNCARFPKEVGIFEAALGLGLEEFDEWTQQHLSKPPIQGGPIQECARRMGFVPGEVKVAIEPLVVDEPTDWFAAEIVIPAGKISGVTYLVEFPTEGGPVFAGSVRFQVRPAEERSANAITIHGDTELRVEMPGFSAWLFVPLGLVRRIPDIITAAPGVVPVADLPPARYAPAVA